MSTTCTRRHRSSTGRIPGAAIQGLIGIDISFPKHGRTLPLNISQPATAIGVFGDNSHEDITALVLWDSSDPTIMNVNDSGEAVAVGVGTTQISATAGDIVGNLTVSAVDAELIAINVFPTNPKFAAGFDKQARAMALFSDSSVFDISKLAAWSSNDETTATVSPAGLVSGKVAGTAQISASLSAVVGTTSVTISDANLISIDVTPADPRVARGFRRQTTATGFFSDGTTLDLTDRVSWDSSDHAVATLTSSGEVVGIAPGLTQITATLGNIAGSTNLTVTSATLNSITITLSNLLPVGYSAQATATGFFSDASTLDLTPQVTWQSSNQGVAVVDSTGLVLSVSGGTAQINAILDSILGTKNLTLSTATLMAISITPSNPAVARDSTLQLTGTGTFSDNNTLDLTEQITWSSTNKSVGTVDDLGLVYGVSGGSTSITARSHAVTGNVTLFVGN